VQACRLYGALLFGAVQLIEDLESHLAKTALVLDLKNLIYVDSTGAGVVGVNASSCHF